MRLPKTPKELAIAALIAFAFWAGIIFQLNSEFNKPAPTWYGLLLLIPIGLLAASIVAWVIQIGVRSAKD